MKLIILFCGNKLDNYNFNLTPRGNIRICAILNSKFYSAMDKNILRKCDYVLEVEKFRTVGHLIELDFAETVYQLDTILQKYKLVETRVVCCYEGDVSIACKIREYLSIPGMNYQGSLVFRNKYEMRSVLKDQGITMPKFNKISLAQLSEPNNFLLIKDHIGLPFIIKPTESGGGYGVKKISSYQDLLNLKEFVAKNNDLEYMAEEFLDGTLYHCDIMLNDGVVIFAECCIYNHNYFGFEDHVVIGSVSLDDGLTDKGEIINYCKHIINKLGSFNGSYHCEVFKKADNICLLEIGARPAGGLILQMYQAMYDVNFFDLDFLIQASLKYDIAVNRKYYGVWAIFFNYHEGVVNNLYSTNQSYMENIKWYFKPGDRVPKNVVVGSLVCIDDSYEVVDKINNELTNVIPFHIS